MTEAGLVASRPDTWACSPVRRRARDPIEERSAFEQTVRYPAASSGTSDGEADVEILFNALRSLGPGVILSRTGGR
jgi:hypothetical protein